MVGLIAIVLFFVGGYTDRPAWMVAAPFLLGTALGLKVLVMLSLGAAYVGPGEPTCREDEPRAFYGWIAYHVALAALAFGGGLILALR